MACNIPARLLNHQSIMSQAGEITSFAPSAIFCSPCMLLAIYRSMSTIASCSVHYWRTEGKLSWSSTFSHQLVSTLNNLSDHNTLCWILACCQVWDQPPTANWYHLKTLCSTAWGCPAKMWICLIQKLLQQTILTLKWIWHNHWPAYILLKWLT